MAIKVVGYRVLVEPEEVKEEVTESGIHIPILDERLAKHANILGTVVDVGENAWKAHGPDYKGTPWANVGQKVLYSKYAGQRIRDPYTNKEYVLLNDEDIIAVIWDDNK